MSAADEPAMGPVLTSLAGLTTGKRVGVWTMNRWCPGAISRVQANQVRVLLDGAGKVTLAIRSPGELRLLDGERLGAPLPAMPTVRLSAEQGTFDPVSGEFTFEQDGVRYVLPWKQQTTLMGKIADGMAAKQGGAGR